MNWQALLDSAQELHRAGRLEEAEAQYARALDAAPQQFAPHFLMGMLRLRQNRFADAVENFDAALAIDPAMPEAQFNRALALMRCGRLEEALDGFRKVLLVRPGAAGALANRGHVLFALWRFDAALADFDGAIAVQPGLAEAHAGRGMALARLNRPEDAVAAFDKAVALAPGHDDAWFHRGIALEGLGRLDEAIASYDRTIALAPPSLGARNNRAVVLQKLRRFGEAAAAYDAILALAPDSPFAVNGLSTAALHACDWSRRDALMEAMRGQIGGGGEIQPGTLLGYAADPELQLACARNYLRGKLPPPAPQLWKGPRFTGAKIRLAYCSADFQSHPMPRLLAGLFESHDRSRFEVLAISFGPDDGSDMRRRLEKVFDRFHDMHRRGDAAIAAMMADMGVDIAIDLMGFTNGARTPVFAMRPAPVQVNYMGFPGTLGADFYDYILADAVALPMAQQDFYPERIVHLPGSYFGTDSSRPMAGPPPSRAEAGLPDNGFVFCCFNNNWKIAPPVFDIWMRLLAAMPGSVLWLLQDSAEAADHLRDAAQAHGIDLARLVFAPRVTPAAHLARHRLADLFLDTLPYNAHTTACDSLWVGVPVVTVPGGAFHSRVAASVLTAMGMGELIASGAQDYEALALDLARDPQRLAALRTKLEARRTTAPLFDTARFTRGMEAAFEAMRDIHLAGAPPRGLQLD